MEETDRARFSVKTRESVISWITSLLDPRREGSTRIMNSMHQQRYTAVLKWKVKISDVIVIEGGHTAPWKFVNGHARATPGADHGRDKKWKIFWSTPNGPIRKVNWLESTFKHLLIILCTPGASQPSLWNFASHVLDTYKKFRLKVY